MTKAPLGGKKTGPNPTDRGKGGVKRSLLTESNRGDRASARQLYEQSLRLFREVGDRQGAGGALYCLGDLNRLEGNYGSAVALLQESRAISRDLKDTEGIAGNLSLLATVLLAQSAAEGATCLWGACHALRESTGLPIPPGEREDYTRQLAEARLVLGPEAFAAAWTTGCAVTWEQAAAFALGQNKETGQR
jgi:tetratricopeptide (TPR) repeat protein